MYGGKRGRALSKAIRASGHDAVITLEKDRPVEVVSLKDIGPEPQGFPEEEKWVPVESSVVKAVAYYEPLRILEFQLRDGQEYSFSGIQKEVFDDLLASPSKGRFFSELVKTRRGRKKA